MADPDKPRATKAPSLTEIPGTKMAGRLIRATGMLSTSLAAGLAERFFTRTNKRVYREGDREFLMTAERVELHSGKERLATYRWGDPARPAVIVMHGWGGNTGRMSYLIERLIATRWSVVGIDAPGHGESAGNNATMPEFAAALERLVPTLSAVQGVVGYSLGGTAALFAASRGTEFTRIVTISAPSEVTDWADRFRDAAEIDESVYAMMWLRMQKRVGVAWHELDMGRAAQKVACPGLIVHDESDSKIPVEQARLLARHWPTAGLHITNGLGHRGTVSDAEVASRILNFLE